MDIMTLLMAQRGGGTGGSGGGSVNSVNGVQPDEAGNVALKYDYVVDRPFGEITVMGDTLTWDGDIEGRAVFNDSFYHISDACPAMADLENGFSFDLSNGKSFDNSSDGVTVRDLGDGAYAICVSFFPAIGFNPVAMENTPVGTYAMSDGDVYVTRFTVNGYKGFETVVIKPIDKKYLPAGGMAVVDLGAENSTAIAMALMTGQAQELADHARIINEVIAGEKAGLPVYLKYTTPLTGHIVAPASIVHCADPADMPMAISVSAVLNMDDVMTQASMQIAPVLDDSTGEIDHVQLKVITVSLEGGA